MREKSWFYIMRKNFNNCDEIVNNIFRKFYQEKIVFRLTKYYTCVIIKSSENDNHY